MSTVLKRIIGTAAAALFAAACLAPAPVMTGGGEARMLFRFAQDGFSQTRSSVSSGEDDISCIQLIVADESGIIAADIFSTSPDGLSFTGTEGHTYTLYALANDPSGAKVPFSSLDEVEEYSFRSSLESVSSHGIPMSYKSSGILLHEGDNPVDISLIRLYARLDFKIDLSDMPHYDSFGVNYVKLVNGNMEMRPFSAMAMEDNSMAGEPDHASSGDLTALCNGQTVTFYVPENLQGKLLPGNDDPWKKTPDQIPDKQYLCTYLEANCSYEAQGLSSESLTYRMYLGEDNLGDFNLRRNHVYKLSLLPSEDEMKGSRGSWKIVSTLWSDQRSLIFSPSTLTVPSLGSASVDILCSPADFEFSVTDTGLGEAGSSWTLSGSTLTVTNDTGLENDALATLTARSWDGAIEESCNLRIKAAIHSISIEPLEDTVIPYGESRQFRIRPTPASLGWDWLLSATNDGGVDAFLTSHATTTLENGILTITNNNPSYSSRDGYIRAWLDENNDVAASLDITLEGNPSAPWLELSPRYLYINNYRSGTISVTLHNCDSYSYKSGMNNPNYIMISAGAVSNGQASISITNRNMTSSDIGFDIVVSCGSDAAKYSRTVTVLLRGTSMEGSCSISPTSAEIAYGSSQTFTVSSSSGDFSYQLEGDGLSVTSKTSNSITVANSNRSGQTVTGWLDVTDSSDDRYSARAEITAPSGYAGVKVTPSSLRLGFNESSVLRVESPSGDFDWSVSPYDDRLECSRVGNLIVVRNTNTSGEDSDYIFHFSDSSDPSVTGSASARAESISISVSPPNATIIKGDTQIFSVESSGDWLWELENGTDLDATRSGNLILVTNNNHEVDDLNDVLRVWYKSWPEIGATVPIKAKAQEEAVLVEHEIVVDPDVLHLSVGETGYVTATYRTRIYSGGVLVQSLEEDVTEPALWTVSNYDDKNYVSAYCGAITGLAATTNSITVTVTYGQASATVGVSVY